MIPKIVQYTLAAGLILATMPAHAESISDIAKNSCRKDLQLSASICECIAARIVSEFNAKQQRFFIASVTKDKNAIMTIAPTLSQQEMMQIATFMTTAPQQCGG